jgi:uncharacterized protein YqjF (DUF2071 family)
MSYGPDSPLDVEQPVMLHRWERLSFLHWSYEPHIVQRLLPSWLTVEPYQDRAWVGLVPFFMRVSTKTGRNVRWASNFCETNVRTYVRDHEGRSGIWFFSLDAERLGAVVTARTTYRLPYFWSKMRLIEREGEIAYTCARRWPKPPASSIVRLKIGAAFSPDELTERDHFLTARWVLFSSRGTRQRFADAHHTPWPLRRAIPIACEDGLLAAAGVPVSDEPPVCHYSDGVDVRIGRPQRYVASSERPR